MIARDKYVVSILAFFISINLSAQPTISSFSPTSGPVGTTVTITGTNFSTTPANNIVYFGAVRANVSASTSTSLTVTVPTGATYQPITVTVNNLTAYSAIPFNITFSGAAPIFTLGSFEYAGRVDSVNSSIETTKYTNADIDNDGMIDVITIDRLNNKMTVYRNTTSSGNVSFASGLDFTTGQSARSVNYGDIDGDGKLDIIVTNLNDNTVSVFRNTTIGSTISFAARVNFTTAFQPSGIAVADIDKDGKSDLVINTINTEGYISVLRNTSSVGSISFAPKIDLQSILGSIENISVADLDTDGKMDIALPNYGLNAVTIFRNTSSVGVISFAAKIDIACGQNPVQLEIADLNNDGKPDIAANYVFTNNNISVFRNTSTVGSISFASSVNYPVGNYTGGIAINDLDGDGKPDMAVTSDSLSLFKNTSTTGGSISFNPIVRTLIIWDAPIFTGDFDGDGKPDITLWGGVFRVLIWKNKVTEPQITSFSPISGGTGTTVTITGQNFSGVTAVSFGGVPASSFTVINSTTITAVVGSGTTGAITVTAPYGTGKLNGFTFTGPIITSFNPNSATTGDTVTINGLNFVYPATTVSFGGTPAASLTVLSPFAISAIVGAGSSGNVSVTTSNGTGFLPGFVFLPPPTIISFTPTSGGSGTTVTITGTNFLGATAVSFGGVPAASFNVNSSTIITAVVAEGATGTIKVTTPVATATSSNSFLFPAPTITSFTPTSGSPGSTVTITGTNFRSNPTSNIVFFGAVRATVTAATTTSLTVIVPTGVTYHPISVTVNNYTVYCNQPFKEIFQDWNAGITSSSFLLKGTFGTGQEDPRRNFLADVDGDGKADMICYNAGGTSGSISILRNLGSNGNISFSPAVNVFTLPISAFIGVAIGDVNADGKPDIVVTGAGDFISVYKNTSSAVTYSFTRTDIPSTPSGFGVAIQDFDGDGKVDIADIGFGASGLGAVRIFRNTGIDGSVSFAPGVEIVINEVPQGNISVADFNDDGKPDIALNIPDSNAIAILKNNSTIGNISFAPRLNIPANFSYLNCVADLDGDGKPDLVSGGNNIFSVLRNTSTATVISFAPKIDYTLNQSPVHIIAGQLDGDGKPDIVIAGLQNTFLIKRNISIPGNISFEPQIIYSLPPAANFSSIGDLEGDGKPEIAIANRNNIIVFRNQVGEQIDSTCANSNTNITSNITGSNYQWQLNSGNGFNNINNNSNYNGTTSLILQISNIPISWNGYQYRCIVDGNNSKITNLVVNAVLIPTGTANSPGQVCINNNFNVVFSPTNLPLNSIVKIYESVNGAAFVSGSTRTYTGSALTFTINNNSTAATKKYFFEIIPPASLPCTQTTNSDTTTTVIQQLDVPIITLINYTMTISNPDASAIYTWQIQGGGGVWNDIIPTINGVSYTATSSGTYRVKGVVGACTQYSNAQAIVITAINPVPGNPAPQLIVSPNPASNNISVQHPSSIREAYIQCIDMLGRIVKTVHVARTITRTDINVEELPSGIYKLTWSDGRKSVTTTVMIW